MSLNPNPTCKWSMISYLIFSGTPSTIYFNVFSISFSMDVSSKVWPPEMIASGWDSSLSFVLCLIFLVFNIYF